MAEQNPQQLPAAYPFAKSRTVADEHVSETYKMGERAKRAPKNMCGLASEMDERKTRRCAGVGGGLQMEAVRESEVGW